MRASPRKRRPNHRRADHESEVCRWQTAGRADLTLALVLFNSERRVGRVRNAGTEASAHTRRLPALRWRDSQCPRLATSLRRQKANLSDACRAVIRAGRRVARKSHKACGRKSFARWPSPRGLRRRRRRQTVRLPADRGELFYHDRQGFLDLGIPDLRHRLHDAEPAMGLRKLAVRKGKQELREFCHGNPA
jgi:hypothetical protein